MVLRNVSEAYGRMILEEGLFQADGHPGNILVRRGGGVALLDYGQSKQLPPAERAAFARLVLALSRCFGGAGLCVFYVPLPGARSCVRCRPPDGTAAASPRRRPRLTLPCCCGGPRSPPPRTAAGRGKR